MHVVTPRAAAEPHARADETAAAVEGAAKVSAAVVAQRRIQPSADGDGVAHDRRRPRESHEMRARDMEVRTAKAMREPDGTIDLLPSYEYAVGADGLPYVIGQGQSMQPPEEAPLEDVPPEDAEPIRVAPDRERAPIEAEAEPPKPEYEPPVKPVPPDDHVSRSYARLDEPETPPKLDTIA